MPYHENNNGGTAVKVDLEAFTMTCISFVLGAFFVLLAYCFVWPIIKTIKNLVNGTGHTQCCGNTIIMEIIWWRGLEYWDL